MFQSRTLQSLIQESIPFLRSIRTGWHVCKCPLCNDYKERAGFKFDGGVIGWHCWNCSSAGRYEEFSGIISKKFRQVLNAFGIDDNEISSVVNVAFFNKEESEKITLKSVQKVNTITPSIKFPIRTFQVGKSEEGIMLQERIVDYLSKRCVDFERYPFFFSLEERFANRVIIPFYRNGQLIYWQARHLDDSEKKRFDNAPANRDAVMFNMDELVKHTPFPLLVVEGVFDALMFNGIATLGSSISAAQLELLLKSPRRKIFVIDKDKNGAKRAEFALNHGWDITFAPQGASDVNKSVIRFGRAWTARQLITNIPADRTTAELLINLNCKS